MKKTAFLLMIFTIFSKIFGFARDITLAYFYGTSNISDVYLISTTIPLVIFSFIGTGINTGYIPMYSKIQNIRGTKEANRFTSNLVNFLIVICTIIFILGFLFANQIVKVFASGFQGDTLALTVKFTRISLFGIYFMGLIYIFNGFLQLKENYIIPALVGFPLNIFIIASIFLSSKTNVVVLSIGSVIAAASQLILVLPFAYKKGYRYKFILDIKDEHIKNMVYIALPVIIGVSVNQINTLVDRTIASQISVGGISALNYANRLNGFVQGIFVLSIATVMYPMISKMAAENNMTGFKKSVSEAISSINLLVLPTTIGAMIFAEPIVRLLFGRGAFDANAISMTSYALFFYSIGMIGFGLREILSRTFYSLQDTKTPMINAAIAMTINIILNIILSKFLGIGGLALATSISAIFCTVLLFTSLRKKIGSFGMKSITISFIKILCASLAMGVIAKVSYNALLKNVNANFSLILSIGIGAITYFAIIYFMKIEEVDVIVNAIKRMMIKTTY
jgi:putative peptidoglycan lipid II flippase